jgi:RHS repeat-associated protein
VGDGSLWLAVNPSTNRIYVTNNSSDNVSVIDGATNTVVATVPVGDAPVGVAVNPSTNRIYVANYDDDTVTVIDGATNAVVATVPVGVEPYGAGVNPTTDRTYVANYGSRSVSVIDGGTNAVVATVPVADLPGDLAVNPSTNRIYVAEHWGDNVWVIDGGTNTVVATVPVGDRPGDMAVNPTANRIYVAHWETDSVSVIDGATNTVVATVLVGDSPAGVAANPLSNRIYVANYKDDTVSVIEDIPTPTPPAAWPMFQHDAQRTGRSPYIGPQEPELKWAFPAEGEGTGFWGLAVGGDGTVYGWTQGGLTAIDAHGAQKWQNADVSTMESPVLAPTGDIYVVRSSPQHSIVALTSQGQVRWERAMGYSYGAELVLDDDGYLYYLADCLVPGGDVHPSLLRVDQSSNISWLYDIHDRITYYGPSECTATGASSEHLVASSPALDRDGNVYLIYGGAALSVSNYGTERWKVEVGRPGRTADGGAFVSVSPTGLIYAAVSGQSGDCVNGLTWADVSALTPQGSEVWRFEQERRWCDGPAWWAAPAIGADGSLFLPRWYYGWSSAVFDILALSSEGSLDWESGPLSYWGGISPAVIGGDSTVYVWAESRIRAYTPAGVVKWTAPASWLPGAMVLAIGPDETLYFAGLKLYAFGSEPPQPASTNGGPAANPYVPHSEEPVNLATGNYALQRTDVNIPGKGLPLSFSRSYNSLDATAARLGVAWTDNYNVRLVFAGDPATSDVTVIQEVGRQDEYLRLDDGSYQPPPGIFDNLVRNGDGTFTLTRKDRSVLQFDSGGVLTSLEDRNGNLTTLTFDAGDRLTAVTDPSSRTLTFSYDASDRITSVTDPLGRVTTYAYDANGDLVSVTDPEGQTTSYTYDANHQMLSITDPRANVIMTSVYDEQGRVTSQTNADGDTWTFSYGDRVTMETDPRGCATVHAYDFRYRETQRTDCLGGVTTYTYDAFGNRASITDPLGRATTMTYDSRGNLLSVTNALSNTTTFTYDAQDNLLSRTDPLGRVTTYTYDANGNLLTSTDALAGVTSFTYDGEGQLLTATDPLSNTSTFTYDCNGYQSSAADPLGNTTSFTYDDGGRLLTQTDPLLHTTTYTYDDVDRLLTVTDAMGHVTTYTYDANGNRTSVTDANGKTTTYTYDALNRLATVTDAESGVVTYTYDSVGNRISMTDANSHTTSYAYDPLDRLISVTDPEGNITAYTYDAVGNRLTRTDANGATTTYTYDALNRLTRISYPDQPPVSYTYDAVGNRLSMTDLTGTTTYTYDVLHRLTSVTNPGGATVSYTYDAAGNRLSLTYPDDKTVSYDYDDASRLVTVADWAARVTSYDYDEASRLTDTDLPNGVHTERTYDDATRLLSIAHTKAGNLLTVAYTVDNLGNRLTRTETVGVDSPLTDTYGYDDLYRLTSVVYGGPYDEQTYSYDPMGNRLQLVEGATTTDYAYDAADGLLTAGSTTFEFDANGNQVREGNRTFTYDRENRLIQVADWTSAPDGTCADTNWDGTVNSGDLLAVANAFGTRAGPDTYQPVLDPRQDGVVNAGDLLLITGKLLEQCQVVDANAYNGDGLRVYRSQDGATERHVWDVAATLPVILQDSSGLAYVHGLDLIGTEDASGQHYYLYDGLGSAIGIADSSGVPEAWYSYDVFGAVVGQTGSVENDFTFTGERWDYSTGLLYLRARYYESANGRFVSRDPYPGLAGVPRSLNRHTYVGNNPANLTDPAGYCPTLRPMTLGALMEPVAPEEQLPLPQWREVELPPEPVQKVGFLEKARTFLLSWRFHPFWEWTEEERQAFYERTWPIINIEYRILCYSLGDECEFFSVPYIRR